MYLLYVLDLSKLHSATHERRLTLAVKITGNKSFKLPLAPNASSLILRGDIMILVVDDNEILALTVCDLLEEINLSTLLFKSANETIEWLKEHSCDLIISDLNMPDGNGIDLSCWVRENKPDINLIIMTALNQVDILHTEKFWELSDRTLLKKPFTCSELFKLVNEALKRDEHSTKVS